MGRKESIDIERHLTESALDAAIDSYESRADLTKSDERILRGLKFVQLRYQGNSVATAAINLGLSRKTGYNIQSSWNAGGIDGIIPKFSNGPKPRLSDAQVDEIIEYLSGHEMDASMLREYIQNTYGEKFTEKHIRNLFIDRGLKYSRDISEYHPDRFPFGPDVLFCLD